MSRSDAADLLQARLQVVLGDSVTLRQAPSLEWAIKNPLPRSICIIFFDDVPDIGPEGNARNRNVQASDQYWLVLVTDRSVEGLGSSAVFAAVDLSDAVLTALLGYALSKKHGVLHWQKCPYRKTDRDGYTHLPLLFSTRIVTQAVLANP